MAKDKIHIPVKEALIDDGWLITDDSLYIKVGTLTVFVDLVLKKYLVLKKTAKESLLRSKHS